MSGEKILDKKEFKILITDENGFFGKNLYYHLIENRYTNIFKSDINTDKKVLNDYILKLI